MTAYHLFVGFVVTVCVIGGVWALWEWLTRKPAAEPTLEPSPLDLHWTDVRDLIDADAARSRQDEIAVARAALVARIVDIRCGILAAELSDPRAVAEWLSDGAR